LPMGVQLAGPMFTETTLLGLAGMLEAALPAMPRNPHLPW
jgi:Asp-tRNA(Asn)/Glu-tRNA(Gln) amidotransferase A subunit family amidase